MSDSVTRNFANDYADLSLVAIFAKIRRRWYVLLASITFFAIASVVYALLATPIYQSSILLAPAEAGSSGGGMASRLLQNFGAGSLFAGAGMARSSRAIALSSLTSPFFTRAFIEDNNLLPILFAEKWDADEAEWVVDSADDIPTLQEGYQLFSENLIRVEESDLNDLVTVYVEWTDPVLAAEWANMIVAGVNSRLRDQAIEAADLTIEYLNDELAKTNAVELQQSLYFLIDGEIQKKTVAKVQKEYAYRVLSPAVPADLDKPLKPRRLFIVSVGIALGIFFGLIISLVIDPVATALRQSTGAANP